MENWLTYIDYFFCNVLFDKVETNQSDEVTFLSYRKNGTYLTIELNDDHKRIKKIECGKYWPSENVGWDFEKSNVKAVLNTACEGYVEFIQTSYFGEDGDEFELEFTERNKVVFKEFMDIPLHLGWVEFLYHHKDYVYKSVIDLKEKKITKEIILMNFAEQDLPMIGDKFARKVDAWWSDLNFNAGNRSFEMELINPMISKNSKK